MSDAPFPATTRRTADSKANSRGAASSASAGPAMRDGAENAGRGRSEAAQIADNILRQRLRIGDPNDPVEVARGLRRLFPAEARQLDAEAAGLPMPVAVSAAPSRPVESMATSAELERADAAVDRDLRALTADHRLGGIEEELYGWGQSIRATLADGRSAAALALDPRARDRLFGARRQLNEYSRLVRMVGALTPGTGSSYRRLGSSLDQAASLLLVQAGETLAGQSLGGSRFLPSVAASELQSRRDGVMSCLRTMLGCSGSQSGCDSFPWSMEGFRDFLHLIEASGHLDLRSLLDEGTLGRNLDALVELAARNDGAGLRALGATADLVTGPLQRLLALGAQVPAAPGLSHFLKALQLFLDTFSSSQAGYRLKYIVRPAILQGGPIGAGQLDTGTERLMHLVGQRARVAVFADCFLACGCDAEDVLRQIMLDRIFHDLERATDLHILGSSSKDGQEPEYRAAACGLLVHTLLRPRRLPGDRRPSAAPFRKGELGKLLSEIEVTLIRGKFHDDGTGTLKPTKSARRFTDAMVNELNLQGLAVSRLEAVVRTMAPGCVPAERVFGVLEDMVLDALRIVQPEHRRKNGFAVAELRVPAPEPVSFETCADALVAIGEMAERDRYQSIEKEARDIAAAHPGRPNDTNWYDAEKRVDARGRLRKRLYFKRADAGR